MATSTDSFEQFNYALRPSKQVERKVMIEVLLRLAMAGFDISSYRYLGFGSPFYVDFVMFHKYLFVKDMLCIEWGDIPKRMKFNKPYRFIKLRLGAFSEYVPLIRPTHKHLIWLDYDRSLDDEMLQVLHGALGRLGRQSLFIVTIDARARLPKGEARDLDMLNQQQYEELTVDLYRRWFKPYTNRVIDRNLIAQAHVAELFHEVVRERLGRTLKGTGRGLRFYQLFNFVYKDGAPMLTVGGLIGSDDDEAALKEHGILSHRYVRTGTEFLEISVPPLTVRERYWLDSHFTKGLSASTIAFELDEGLLQNYLTFYKEYPTYLETLL